MDDTEDRPTATAPLIVRIAPVLSAAVAVAALPLGHAAFADLQTWVRWFAVLIVLSGLGLLAAAVLQESDRSRAGRLLGAALGVLGVALAVTWLGPREAPSGLMTVEYEDHAAVCGDVSWATRGYLRVEVSYTDPDAKTHITDQAGRYEPDGHVAVLIPTGRVHSLVSADTCPQQQKP